MGYLLVGLHQYAPPHNRLETLPATEPLLGHLPDREEGLTQYQFEEDAEGLS